MGGGDNELIIKTILDNTGFAKGSKQLKSAINGLSNSIKSMFGRIVGVASVFGVLSKAVSTFMSQNQQLTKQMNAAWTALGNALGPIITQLINWVTQAVSYLVTLMKLLGLTSKTASQASKAAQGAGGALQRTVAGFDELNKLSSGGGGGAGTLKDVDPVEWMNGLAEALKNKMWDDAADIIIQKMNEIIAAFRKKANEIGDIIGEWLGGITHIVARVINETNWSEIGTALAEFFLKAFKNVSGEDIGAIIVGKLTIAFKIVTGFLSTEGLGARLGELLSGIITGAFNSLASAIEGADFQAIGNNIREFFLNIDWEGIAVSIFELLKSAWNGALDLLGGIIGGDSEEEPIIITKLRELGDKIGELVGTIAESYGPTIKRVWEDYVKPAVDWLINSGLPEFIDFLIGYIDKTIEYVSKVGEELQKLLDGEINLSEFIGFVLGSIAKFFTDINGKLNEFLNGIMESLGLGFDDIKGFIERTWQGIVNWWHDVAFRDGKFTLQGLLDGIWEKVRNIADWVKTKIIDPFIKGFREGLGIHSPSTVMEGIGGDIIQGLFDGLEDAWANVVSWLSNLWSEFSDVFGNIASNAWSWGSDLIGNLWNGISSQLSGFFGGIRNIAQGIRNFLGFSEPKVGPLSDFHTFGPDMMQLYAQGIEGESGKVFAAVNDVAEGVADGLAISPNAMSAVASGSVIPYSVTGGMQGMASPSDNVSTSDMRDILVEIRDLLNNMEFVAQFGDLRAVAQRITTIQKQMERARG